MPFYKQAFILKTFYDFIKSEKICGKACLADIEDELLRNKIRTAIYGGVKNLDTSFAKFMYNTFGICAENASSFEESIKYYESWGDSVKVSIKSESWISSISIDGLVSKLYNLIAELSHALGIKLSEIGLQEYNTSILEVIEPTTLLPSPGEKAEKLVSLLNDFKQNALDLSIGVNPFTTFVFYSRHIPLSILMGFLECDMDKIIKLINFLGFRSYSMTDLSEVSLPTKSPDKVILFSSSLAARILELQDSVLKKIDPTINEIYTNMIKKAINQIYITFDPWKDYESIFSFLSESLKDRDYSTLHIENGRIRKISSGYKEVKLSSEVWLRDFLIKISPLMSFGIISISYYSRDSVKLCFHHLARDWIEKVIENERKI
ncbi:MAG: hypothetical protein QXS96_07790 [Candidatus Caldarchaeum sp.]